MTPRQDLPRDTLARPLRSLRLSVTDRCNLRCSYCMPADDYVWLPHADVLTFEETCRLTDAFVALGVDRVRITGGEPLLRRDLHLLVSMLAKKPGITDLAMTTNGVLLDRHARSLADAGLHRVTVSLDTLDRETFRLLTRRDDLPKVLRGIDAAREAGLDRGLKIDTVLIAGVNDGEMDALLDYGREIGAEVRFIEYMDVGGATEWSMDRVVPRREILRRLAERHGEPVPLPKSDAAPADRYRLPDGTVFGVISSTTQPFCATCDRSRVTADGTWFTCLYAREGTDLRALLRGGASDDEILAAIRATWQRRADRGAEERLAVTDRRPLVEAARLREDPRLEMHTRGG